MILLAFDKALTKPILGQRTVTLLRHRPLSNRHMTCKPGLFRLIPVYLNIGIKRDTPISLFDLELLV